MTFLFLLLIFGRDLNYNFTLRFVGIVRHRAPNVISRCLSYVPVQLLNQVWSTRAIPIDSTFPFLWHRANLAYRSPAEPEALDIFLLLFLFFFFFQFLTVDAKKRLVTCDPLAREYSISDAFLLSNERGPAATFKATANCFQFLSSRRIRGEIFADLFYGALNVCHPAVFRFLSLSLSLSFTLCLYTDELLKRFAKNC